MNAKTKNSSKLEIAKTPEKSVSQELSDLLSVARANRIKSQGIIDNFTGSGSDADEDTFRSYTMEETLEKIALELDGVNDNLDILNKKLFG